MIYSSEFIDIFREPDYILYLLTKKLIKYCTWKKKSQICIVEWRHVDHFVLGCSRYTGLFASVRFRIFSQRIWLARSWFLLGNLSFYAIRFTIMKWKWRQEGGIGKKVVFLFHHLFFIPRHMKSIAIHVNHIYLFCLYLIYGIAVFYKERLKMFLNYLNCSWVMRNLAGHWRQGCIEAWEKKVPRTWRSAKKYNNHNKSQQEQK